METQKIPLDPEMTETLTRLADESDELWCGRIGDNIRDLLANDGFIPEDLIRSIHLDSAFMVDLSYLGRQVCDIQADVRRIIAEKAIDLEQEAAK